MYQENNHHKLKKFEELINVKLREKFLRHPMNDRTIFHIKDTISECLGVCGIHPREYDFICRLDEYSNTLIISPGNQATKDLYDQLNWEREK